MRILFDQGTPEPLICDPGHRPLPCSRRSVARPGHCRPFRRAGKGGGNTQRRTRRYACRRHRRGGGPACARRGVHRRIAGPSFPPAESGRGLPGQTQNARALRRRGVDGPAKSSETAVRIHPRTLPNMARAARSLNVGVRVLPVRGPGRWVDFGDAGQHNRRAVREFGDERQVAAHSLDGLPQR